MGEMLSPNSIKRLYSGSLDADYSFESLDLLKEYATTSPLAYSGQLLYDEGSGILYKVNQDKTDVDAVGSGSGASIDDTTTSTTKAWSSSKTESYVSDTATTQLIMLNQKLGNYYNKTEVDTAISGVIDDTTASDTTTYSSNKIDDLISQATGTSNSKIIVCADAVDTVDLASDRYQYLLADYTIHKVTEGIDVDVTDEVYVNIIRIEEAQYDALPDEEKNKDYTWYVT